MSKSLELLLDENKEKPIFEIVIDNRPFRCMLDTGAEISVWCGKENLFARVFPDKKKYYRQCTLGGFGGKGTRADVYCIPHFKIGDSKDFVQINNFYCVVSYDREFGCDLIISGTTFSKMDYAIINRLGNKHKKLKIDYDKDIYTMGIKCYDDEVVSSYVFSQDNV